MELFVGINIEDPTMENLRRSLKIFTDNERKQQFFTDKYSRLKLLFEVLSPDPFLSQYLRKFEWITSFYLAFVKEFRSQGIDHELLAEYGEKVKTLIQERIDYEGITRNFRELKVNDVYTLDRLNKMDDDEKARNLEKIIKQEISINVDTNPVFQRFSERLSAIKKEFENQQIDLSERIKRYYELLNDIKSKADEAKELGLDLREFGLFTITQEYVKDADQKILLDLVHEVANRLSDILDEGWQNSSKREEFIKGVKQALQEIILKEYKGKIKVSDFSKYLNRLIDIIVKRF